jgi:hypothetical protein
MISQRSPAVRGVHATLTRKAISREVGGANTKMTATVSVVSERIPPTLFDQNFVQSNHVTLCLRESNHLLSLACVRTLKG